jgi:iron complex outermembrane receptor protein
MDGLRAFRRAGALVVFLVAAAGAGATRAQEDAASGAEPDPPTGPADLPEVAPPPGIEAIEVTGERLNDANVQDEAQAISAFTAEDLQRANIANVDTLQFNVPGLHVGQSAQAPIITLRGIGTENASLTGEPGVAFHVDGINLGRPAAARVAFFDLETLDVKRGPQGLLGGKNSTSGSINLITKKPTDEFEVSGDVLSGNYDRIRLRGAINVPLGEFAASRFAIYRETRDGFLDNPLVSDSEDPFDADDFGLRGHLRVNPSDSLELRFSYNYFKQDGNGPQADPVPIPKLISPDPFPPPGYQSGCPAIAPDLTFTVNPLAAVCHQREVAPESFVPLPTSKRTVRYMRRTGRPFETVPATVVQQGTPFTYDQRGRPTSWIFPTPATGWDPATEDSDPREVWTDSLPSQRNRYWGWSTNVGWDAPAAPLLGETRAELLVGFQKTIGGIRNDFDATDVRVSYYEADDEANQYSGELKWSGLGIRERLEWQASLFYLHEKAERATVAPGITDENAGQTTDQTTDNKSYGAALNGGFEVTDTLRFTLGGRFVKDKKNTWMLRTLFGDVPGTSQLRGCTGDLGTFSTSRPNRDCTLVFRGTMWGSGLDWRPFGDDHLLYAKIDRGYKSGGFRAGTVGEYLPEKIWAYALGSKSEFFDQRLRVNLEGFVYNYTDLQLVIIDGLSLRTENTDARMYGWDLEAQAAPIEGLQLSAVLSYLHTETIDYFSLDPANTDQFQARRLGLREQAEANAAEGLPGDVSIFAKDPTCYTSPTDATYILCGRLGEKDGLDDFSGNELSRAPAWKTTLSAEYEIPLGRFGSLTPRVQYTWQDDTFFRAFNKDFEQQDAYHLTDAKVTWSSPERRWSVEAFVQNIEDEAAKQNILIGPRYFGSPALAWYNPPRFYGVQVGFKY